MAMRDVLKDAIVYAKTPISDVDFLRWYNTCLRELAMQRDTAKRLVDTTVTVAVAGEWHTLSSECMGVRRVVDSSGDQLPADYWTVRDWEEISIMECGTFTVTEQQFHPAVATLAATTTIHKAYNDAIALYVASRCASENRDKLTVDYKNAADMADYAIRRTRGRNVKVHVDPYF